MGQMPALRLFLLPHATGWLWFWIRKALRSWQTSCFSEGSSPLPHVYKPKALPEAPSWIWRSQEHIQWCSLHAVSGWGDTLFLCLQLLSGRVLSEYLTPLLSQLCFDGSLGIFTCFAIFMTPHWSNYRVSFSEKNLVTAMTRCFSMELCTLSPSQAHGNGIPYIQKFWIYQQLYNSLQNSITLETPA